MPVGNWNLQWLNHNSQRAYPFVDWATLQDKTRTIRIPDSFLVAMDLPVPAGALVDPARFYLRQLGIYPTGIGLTFGYADPNGARDAATVHIAKTGHVENRTYAVAGIDEFAESVGKVVLGRIDEIDMLPAGLYEFDLEDTALETDVIRPVIQGIGSLRVINGTDETAPIYGDIELAAGSNMRLSVEQTSTGAKIVLDAIEGEGLTEDCECDTDVRPEDSPCIRFINGIPPLIDGNYKIVGDECLEVVPTENGIQLRDKCSEPCCGCEELQALQDQMKRFADGAKTLEMFASTLMSQVSQLRDSIIASKTTDGSCPG